MYTFHKILYIEYYCKHKFPTDKHTEREKLYEEEKIGGTEDG